MVASNARIAANRANCLKSTGPKTPEGKARSRMNALKHGLCASVVVAEDLAAVNQRAVEMFDTLKPQNELHCWLVDQAALATIRIDRCERIERRVRDKVALRAGLTWDDDRKLEAERMGGRLADRPGEVVGELKKTPQGCDWLIGRWGLLAHAADTASAWTPAQARLAFNLLGTPAEFREGVAPGASLDRRGFPVDPAGDPAAVARAEIDRLEGHRLLVVDLDEAERSLTEADLVNDNDAELRRLRRYENGLHKRLRWCLAELRIQSPYRCADPSLRPVWEVDPVPEPKPEPPTPDEVLAQAHPAGSWSPPFDLEPDEFPAIGQKPDVPAILESRKAKRLAKAESRRQARRRKAEGLRT